MAHASLIIRNLNYGFLKWNKEIKGQVLLFDI